MGLPRAQFFDPGLFGMVLKLNYGCINLILG